MAMTEPEAVQKLTKTNEVLVKIASETESLQGEIKKLEEALAAAGGAGGTITPELEAAVNATAQRVDAIDALVADVAPPEGK
jgi:hypothetical protein